METGNVDDAAGRDAAYFSALAQRYQSLAQGEPHQAQSDLFATIAADYAELAATAGAPVTAAPLRDVAESVAGAGGPLSRWVHWWRRPVVPLQLPLAPTAAK